MGQIYNEKQVAASIARLFPKDPRNRSDTLSMPAKNKSDADKRFHTISSVIGLCFQPFRNPFGRERRKDLNGNRTSTIVKTGDEILPSFASLPVGDMYTNTISDK
jgi:hypothetical protein